MFPLRFENVQHVEVLLTNPFFANASKTVHPTFQHRGTVPPISTSSWYLKPSPHGWGDTPNESSSAISFFYFPAANKRSWPRTVNELVNREIHLRLQLLPQSYTGLMVSAKFFLHSETRCKSRSYQVSFSFSLCTIIPQINKSQAL